MAFNQGAFDFVPKPFDRDHLIWSVDLAIKAHRLRRRIEERRVYVAQLKEVMHRRWRQPLPSNISDAIEPSRSLMGASFDKAEQTVRRAENVVERTERMLRRAHVTVRQQAWQWLH